MHELALIESVMETVLEEMKRNNLSRVESITLRIGKMRQYVPDALTFGLECLSKDTPLEGAKLIIEEIPIKGHCSKCNREFIFKNMLDNTCPSCGEITSRITSGKELELVEFEGGV